MRAQKVVFASSEVTPYAKTGGLADVSASLPRALASLGHQVQIVMPFYRSILEGNFDLEEHKESLAVPFRGQVVKERVAFTRPHPNLVVYFIKRDEFFDRSRLYGTAAGDYDDNPERFIFFSRAILELAKLVDFQPDIIHCNDWQTGLVPAYLKSLYREDTFFRNTRTIFTIHNLAYQGVFPKGYMSVSGLPPEFFTIQGLEYFGQMSFMKAGVVFSDIITTVSEKYAREVQTPEYGYGLEGVLEERKNDFYGVLNGVDYTDWNPETDRHILAWYSANDVSGKKKCKEDLLRIFNLKGTEETPVIGMVSRFADQKGFDLVAESAEELVRLGYLLVLLGQGEEKYEKEFAELGRKFKGRFGVRIAFDNVLAHKIEAGSDLFLMPSRYEPCGLNQMYSLKYGTIPVVRATGGLDDTIREFDPEKGEGNGFKFEEYSSAALIEKARKVLAIYRNKKLWSKLVENAMREDFSWERSARQYEKIYERALSKS